MFTKVCGDKGLCVGCGSQLFWWSVKLKEMDRYRRAVPQMELKQIVEILYRI